MSKTISINKEKCIRCGLCIEDCPAKNIKKNGEEVEVIKDVCLYCGHCVAICPKNAISINILDSEEIIELDINNILVDDSNLLTFMKKRRSIRKYKDIPVEKEKLKKIIEAGRFSPTGGNRQPIKYTVVNSSENINKLRNMSIETLYNISQTAVDNKIEGLSQSTAKRYIGMWEKMYELNKNGVDRLFFHAPAIIVVHGDTRITPMPTVDGAIAASQMVLMAESLGLGTCYIGFINNAYRENKNILKFLGIPDYNKVITTFVIGYPGTKYFRTVPRNKPEVFWM